MSISIDPICLQLRAARMGAGRSQQSVADEAGVGQPSVSDWENGEAGITLSSLRNWARSLDHTVVLLPMSSPDSTSPEPGPPTCPDYPDCSEERLVRDFAASVAAGEPVGRWTSGCAACGTLTKGDIA